MKIKKIKRAGLLLAVVFIVMIVGTVVFMNTLSRSYISAITTIKGTESLSWDDFDQFSYEDIGSGRYVYKYNLPDGGSLFMAGDSLDKPPATIYIIEKDGTETIIKE